MFRRRFAKLLFCVSLLAQIATPVLGVAAKTAERGDQALAFCDPSIADHQLVAPPTTDSGKAPVGRHVHHSECALCSLGVATPLVCAIFWADRRVAAWTRVAPIGATRSFVPEILKHGAAPRAPPSLV
jgi:hypothetical protein